MGDRDVVNLREERKLEHPNRVFLLIGGIKNPGKNKKEKQKDLR